MSIPSVALWIMVSSKSSRWPAASHYLENPKSRADHPIKSDTPATAASPSSTGGHLGVLQTPPVWAEVDCPLYRLFNKNNDNTKRTRNPHAYRLRRLHTYNCYQPSALKHSALCERPWAPYNSKSKRIPMSAIAQQHLVRSRSQHCINLARPVLAVCV